MNPRSSAVIVLSVLVGVVGCSDFGLFRRSRLHPCNDCPPAVLAGPGVPVAVDPYSPVSLNGHGPVLPGTPLVGPSVTVGPPISGPILPAVPPINGTQPGAPIIYQGPGVPPTTGPGGELLLPMPTPEGKVPPLTPPPKTIIPDARPMPYVPPADPTRLQRPAGVDVPTVPTSPLPPAKF